MPTKSGSDAHQSRLSFDRVELERPPLGDRDLELALGADLGDSDVRSTSWIYDQLGDEVIWTTPVETFFGFPAGTTGFFVTDGELSDGSDPATPRNGSEADSGASSASDLADALLAPILTAVRAGVPPTEFEMRRVVHCPDGCVRQVVLRASPLVDEPISALLRGDYVGVVIDATAQFTFERGLRELVDRYRLLTELSPDMVIVHQDGKLVYGNRAASALVMGTEPTDASYVETIHRYYGRPMTDFVDPEDIPEMVNRLSRLTEPGQFVEHGEARVVAPDGSSKVMDITSVRTTWNGSPAYQVILRDVSERRAAEAAARYRASLVAHVSDAIIGIDAEGK
ncbi:MAG TPA: PAS domain S-box protein, partial [Acidimicrobiales bacterium]|nr:PAS domain S-box protein [Acidimicrobiales bacterium]